MEQKLRETKKRKREKWTEKLKALDEVSEKEKNKWKSFNTKVSFVVVVFLLNFKFIKFKVGVKNMERCCYKK